MELEDYMMIKEYYPQFFNEDNAFMQNMFDSLWYGCSHEEIAIMCYKNKLVDTDYKAIKWSEGWLTDEEYAPDKALRQHYRDRIAALNI